MKNIIDDVYSSVTSVRENQASQKQVMGFFIQSFLGEYHTEAGEIEDEYENGFHKHKVIESITIFEEVCITERFFIVNNQRRIFLNHVLSQQNLCVA